MASSGVAFWDSLLGVFLTVDVGDGLYRPDPTGSTIAVLADGSTIIVSASGIKVDPVAVGLINPDPTTVPLRDTGGELRATKFIAGVSVLMTDPPIGLGATSFTATGPRWSEGDDGIRDAARRLVTVTSFPGSTYQLTDLDIVVTGGGNARRLPHDSIAVLDGTVTPLIALPDPDSCLGAEVIVKEYTAGADVEAYATAGATIDEAGGQRTVSAGTAVRFVSVATGKWSTASVS